MYCNVYQKLLQAVKVSKDLIFVRVSLSKGLDVNKIIDKDGSTLLHHADTVDIIRELLLYGASVNARNKFGDTPLHIAITYYRSVEVVRELLKHGASIDIRNNDGDTVMYLAVVLRDDVEVTKELLKYSNDIDIRILEHSPFTLDFANNIDYSFMECVRLFIKIITIKNYDSDYVKIINLANYIKDSDFSEFTDYMDECVYEIAKMKMHNVGNYSVYDLTMSKHGDVKPLFHKNKVSEEDIALKYPVYQDIIIPNIRLCLERGFLLNKLRGIHGYIGSDASSEENNVFLDPDCMCRIARYLSSDDLLNLIAAFDRNIMQTLKVYSSNSHLRIRRKPVFGFDENYGIVSWCCNIL